MDYLDDVKSVGVSIAALIALATFLWRLLIWLKPWAEKAITAHINLVNVTCATIKRLEKSYVDQNESIAQVARAQMDIVEAQKGWTKYMEQATVQLEALRLLIEQGHIRS